MQLYSAVADDEHFDAAKRFPIARASSYLIHFSSCVLYVILIPVQPLAILLPSLWKMLGLGLVGGTAKHKVLENS